MDMDMSVNSSSFADLLFLQFSLNDFLNCCTSRMGIDILSALSFTYVLLLPVLILVLYLGHQRWRKQRFTATSHSDLFTYHSIVMQLNEFLGLIFFFCGGYFNLTRMLLVGMNVLLVTSLGQALFHLLTCVERYLAVVHPIIYLGLKQEGGVRIRNISIGCVWLLSLGYLASSHLASYEFNAIVYFCSLVLFLIAISFFSISVLCALKRPGPGEVGGNRERVDQSKQRAFHTIMAIMGMLLFRFGGHLITNVIYSSVVLSASHKCVMLMSAFWFDLPSGLVLPLLFLHRAGKLQCCKQNTESG